MLHSPLRLYSIIFDYEIVWRATCVLYIYSFTLSAPLQVNAPLAAREAKAVVDDIRNHSMTDADAFKRSNEGMRALVRFLRGLIGCLEVLIGLRRFQTKQRGGEGAVVRVHEYTNTRVKTRVYTRVKTRIHEYTVKSAHLHITYTTHIQCAARPTCTLRHERSHALPWYAHT